MTTTNGHTQAYWVQTDDGYVAWLQTDRGVRASVLPHATLAAALARLGVTVAEPADARTDPVAKRLVDHYAGAPSELDLVPLDLPGETDFQAAVRAAVKAIPRGQVRSYGEIAKAVGRPRAARAVGQVMAHNPVAPFVPCHRVVAADGSLGGFGGGLPMKRRLLLDEGYRCADS